MNLFEINDAIVRAFENWIDPETGEIMDSEAEVALDSLTMEKEQKVENIACWIKNLTAEAEALKKEKQAFAERQARAERKAESLKRYLSAALDGEKITTARASIGWRKSEQVIVDDPANFIQYCEKMELDGLLKYKEPEINKTALKEELKAGSDIPGARLETKNNIQIK